MSDYRLAGLDELELIPVAEGLEWRPIRRRFGIEAFGANAYTSERVGGWIVEEHTEEQLGHEELYVVVSGRARFSVGDETFDAPAGTLVGISDPALRRVAVAEEEGTTVVAVGGKPGEAFEPSAWEWYFVAYPLSEAERHEEAIAVMVDGLAAKPDHPAVLYHLACVEARAGRTDDALAHVRRAIELDPGIAARVRESDDLAPLRERL
jgi:tetratricopeptide (TPR) repeat protein